MITYAYISLPTELGEAVRAARKEQGLTQSELAQMSGCSQRFVSELERGKNGAEMGKVLQVLRALGLSVTLSDAHSPARSRQLVEQGIDRICGSLTSNRKPRKRLSAFLGE